MPHQCTTCGHTFADGSKEMLSGCPDCGGNTFQFHPAGTEIPDEPPSDEPPEPETSGATNRVGRAATKVRDFVGGGSEDRSGSAPTTDTGATASGASADTASGASTDTAGTSTDPDPDAPWPDDAPPDPSPDDGDDSEIIDADARREAAEDRAQSSARGEVASADEVPSGVDRSPAAGPDTAADAEAGTVSGGNPPASGGSTPRTPTDSPPNGGGRVVSEPTGEQPDIDELREQLNDQFESIKIVEPGEYELNLMELYNREEYIIALQENGRYVIQVPENWLGDRPGADRS
jgi:hypothetical protein